MSVWTYGSIAASITCLWFDESVVTAQTRCGGDIGGCDVDVAPGAHCTQANPRTARVCLDDPVGLVPRGAAQRQP